MADSDQSIEALEKMITEAEARKRAYVKLFRNNEGDEEERVRLYIDVERARKTLREYKRLNP